MVNRGWQTGLLISLLGCSGATAAEVRALDTARSTLGQWVQTRQLISRTRADWQAEKEMLEHSLALFETERQSLTEQAAEVSTHSVQVARERGETGVQTEALEAGLATVADAFGPVEEQLRRLSERFPSPLLRTVQPLLDRLPADPGATAMTPVQRVQTVVTLMNEVEKFNSMVTLSPELRAAPDGGEIKVQVLYFGLGQGWFVDESGRFAGRGAPGAGGWQWTTDPALGAPIKQLIAMYEEKQPAQFVPLPVEIQ